VADWLTAKASAAEGMIASVLYCNRFLMKLFKTSDIKVVKDCQIFFNFELPSALLVKRFDKFISCSAGTDVQFSSVCDIQ